jgi:hypothetical protein
LDRGAAGRIEAQTLGVSDKAPEPAVMAQYLTYMSCSELFKFVPTRARFDVEIAQLPADWVVRICGFLEYVRDAEGHSGSTCSVMPWAPSSPSRCAKTS